MMICGFGREAGGLFIVNMADMILYNVWSVNFA